MKKRNLKIMFLLSLVSILTLGSTTAMACVDITPVALSDNNSEMTKSTNPSDYPKDSRDRFVASMAQEKEISFEEADALERAECSKYQTVARKSDEVLKYRTIDKYAGAINGKNGYSVKVHIATEIRYVYNTPNRKPVSLESLGAPYIYIPKISNCSLSTGGFNKEKHTTSGRISATGALSFVESGTTVSVGGDILGVSKTFVIKITSSDLKG